MIYQIPHVSNWAIEVKPPYRVYHKGSEVERVGGDELDVKFMGKDSQWLAALALDKSRLGLPCLLQTSRLVHDGLPRLVFPKGGIESIIHKGYYLIPGFYDTLVSKSKPHVFIGLSGFKKVIGSGADGYHNVSVKRYGKNTYTALRVHRLILLAFDHEGSYPNKEANHRDLDKINNVLSNLDWLSPSENQMYTNAVRTYGYDPEVTSKDLIERFILEHRPNYLDPDTFKGDKVKIYDVSKGEIVFCGTLSEALVIVPVTSNSMMRHVMSKFPDKVIGGKFRVYFESDEISTNGIRKNPSRNGKKLHAKNEITGEDIVFDSVVEFMAHSGLSRKQAFGRLARGTITACQGWWFEYVKEE